VRDLAERHLGAEAVAARTRAGSPVPVRGPHVLFGSTLWPPACVQSPATSSHQISREHSRPVAWLA
jgi:hypothetical protein